MDVGTAFGGIGSSREMMIASLAEPAMLLVVFTVALVAGTTQLSAIATAFSTASVGLRVSLGLALFAFVFVGDRRERPHPDRQSGHPSRAHHGARGHGAGIFRPPPRDDRGRRRAQARALFLAARLPVRAIRHGDHRQGAGALALGIAVYLGKILVLAVLLPIGETAVAKMRVFRYPIFLGGAFAAAALAVFLLFVSRGF